MSNSSEMDEFIAAGRGLARDGRHLEALYHFEQLAAQYPDEAGIQYELASARSGQGMEREAIAAYRKAIQLGLVGEALAGAMLGLGCSLRNVGEYEDAVQVLTSACNHFPDFTPLRAFLALALYSAGRAEEAVVMLLNFLTTEARELDLHGYGPPIKMYTDELHSYSERRTADVNTLLNEQTIQ